MSAQQCQSEQSARILPRVHPGGLWVWGTSGVSHALQQLGWKPAEEAGGGSHHGSHASQTRQCAEQRPAVRFRQEPHYAVPGKGYKNQREVALIWMICNKRKHLCKKTKKQTKYTYIYMCHLQCPFFVDFVLEFVLVPGCVLSSSLSAFRLLSLTLLPNHFHAHAPGRCNVQTCSVLSNISAPAGVTAVTPDWNPCSCVNSKPLYWKHVGLQRKPAAIPQTPCPFPHEANFKN